jgi:hypothetical protein
MNDYFAALGLERRPWLDPDALKNRFLALSTQAHPDRVHSCGTSERHTAEENYARLNAAYQCLREPRNRLRHLLELETGQKPPELQEIPAPLMEVFLEVGALCREVDAFLTERDAVKSPLLKVPYLKRSQEWADRLDRAQRGIAGDLDALAAKLRHMDQLWEATRSSKRSEEVLHRLEELYRLFSYHGRWRSQLQERILRLVI